MRRVFMAVMAVVCLLSICTACTDEKNRITPGRYSVMGFTSTPQAMRDGVELSSMPVMTFHADKRKVTISSDFDFGYFADSVYRYRYNAKKGELRLSGPNDEKLIMCEPLDERSYEMYLGHKYMQRVTIVRDGSKDAVELPK